MNNNVSPEKKDSILKSLAVAGFIGIVVLIAWLSIQLVNILPGAFSSLASIAEGLNQYQETLVEEDESKPLTSFAVTSNQTLVNSGEPVTVTWEKASARGSYTFSYTCDEGIAVDLLNVDGLKSIACDTNYNVGDTTTVDIVVDSEKERYADIRYSIAFLRTNDTTPHAYGNASLAIVNDDISNFVTTQPEDEPSVVTPNETPATEEPAPVITTTTPKPAFPVYTQEFVYEIPTSNPNGVTDLSVRFLNVGTISGKTFSIGEIEQNEGGAIQFEVKNAGTKTSKDWTFSISLPNGDIYESKTQLPLKPNERAVLTVGFIASDELKYTFNVAVDESTDKNTRNDTFSQPITFVK